MTRSRATTRRAVLRGTARLLAAAGTAGLLLPRNGRAEVGSATSVGNITVWPVSDGTRQMPVSLLWPDAPEAELAELLGEVSLPEAIPTPNNVTLIDTGDRLVLVDAGSGPNFDPASGRLEDALQEAGIEPAAVTEVIITHGHPDHLWGALDDFEELPRFPNARYLMSEPEHAFWTAPLPSGMPPIWEGMALGAARVIEALGPSLEVVAPDAEIATGITLVPTFGHTPGHVSVRVADGAEALFVLGDAITNDPVSFRRPGWPLRTDADPDAGAATRRRLLDMLSTEGVRVLGFHLPWPGLGRIKALGESRYAFHPG